MSIDQQLWTKRTVKSYVYRESHDEKRLGMDIVFAAPVLAQYTAPGARHGESLVTEFVALKRRWKSETMFVSSSSQRIMNFAYQRIIGLGPAVIPLLLYEMLRAPDHWHWALAAITGEDPVGDDVAGRPVPVADAWVKWGRERGLVGA